MNTGLPIVASRAADHGIQDPDLFQPTDECMGEGARTLVAEETAEDFISLRNFQTIQAEVSVRAVELGRNPDLWLYRERTIALLRRYLRISVEVGRLPSLLGRELFRSKVTSYRMSSFEDAVIFVHDVERALEQLDDFGKDLVAVVIFQDYSQDEAAEVLQCARRTLCREFPETVDKISEFFLEGGLLNRLPPRRPVENSCQGGKNTQFPANVCKEAE
ncbi:MAG: hypothetical protein AUG89_08760 [Acidobacteria bacterium 13_1_20CM_4_56_7]|nr:MAG: hypothetical protein AUG89_08760 [Acidobacteria bacterium 13_1_20CM_4_56_7]PYV50762.1 MAG: hypothetical protein DMG92_06555 [Acidobacteriota bacterium]